MTISATGLIQWTPAAGQVGQNPVTVRVTGPSGAATLGFSIVVAGQAGLRAANDFDGDGKTDIAVYRPGDGNWYIRRSSDNAVAVRQWGAPGDITVSGDYDGDGKADYAVWRPSTGMWFIIRSSDGAVTQTQWGTGTFFAVPDVPVSGDFDGDGKSDIAVWRPSDGNWYIIRSSDGGVTVTQWGVPSDVPVF
ncbi:MAG: VCBS repeat-containing protein [Deltaproteobacteria bacterium]|nr:VCBS repeat-containing protein [Deltaproteobacteria bacterium]